MRSFVGKSDVCVPSDGGAAIDCVGRLNAFAEHESV